MQNHRLQIIKIPSFFPELPIVNKQTVPELIIWIHKICKPYPEINSYLLTQLLFEYLKPRIPLVKYGYDIVSCWNLRKEYFGFSTPYTWGDKLLLQFPRQLIIDEQFLIPVHNFRDLCFKFTHSNPCLIEIYFYNTQNSSSWVYAITLNLTNLYPCSKSVYQLLSREQIIDVISVSCPIKSVMNQVKNFSEFNNMIIDLLSFPDTKDCLFNRREKNHCLDPRNKDNLGRPFKMKQLWDVCQRLYQNNMLL